MESAFILCVLFVVGNTLENTPPKFLVLFNYTAVTPGCGESLKLYSHRFNNFIRNDIWAIKMWDASAKLPPGILYYNFAELGHFQQCVEIKSTNDYVMGRYCVGRINLDIKLADGAELDENKSYINVIKSSLGHAHDVVGSPSWAICIPSNCTNEDAIYLINISQDLGTTVESINCQTIDEVYPPLNADATIGIIILVILLLVTILSTAYDVYCHKNQKEHCSSYIAFSMYTNGKKLLHIPKRESTLSCLDGIRVISMIWVLIFHTYLIYTAGPIFNPKDFMNFNDYVVSMLVSNGNFACDTFLIVGGTLVTYTFFKNDNGTKINLRFIVKHYFHRYIRLTPPLAGVVLVSATLLKYMGSGPYWVHIVNNFQGRCRKYWWSALLYVQNVVNVDEMCAYHSWYLNVDMQLFILSPIIFLLLQKNTKTGITLLVLSILASIYYSLYITLEHKLWGIQTDARSSDTSYMTVYYTKTESRASCWLIGAILGYMLTIKQLKSAKMSKKEVTFIWIFSLLVMLITLLGGHGTLRGPEYKPILNAIYIALARPAFALSVGWIIWACSTNNGGVINTILSLPIFKFLNKFIYSMYLLHVTGIYMIVFSQKTPVYISFFNMAYWFWGITMFTFGLSVICILALESPMTNLEAILLKKIDSSKETRKIVEPIENI